MFTFKLRRGTSAQWTAANPVLSSGEPGLETDTRKFKIGDGVTTWAQLPDYLPDYLTSTAITEYINSAVANASPITPEDLEQIATQVLFDIDSEIQDLVLLWENAKA